MPQVMTAIDIIEGRCVPVQVPVPVPGPGQVRIAVHAAGVNRADLVQKSGRYPPPPGASPILGLEASGTIAEVGEGVEIWRVGDPCCALLTGGGYAQHVVADAGHVLPRPPSLDHVHAAAVVEVYATAFLNLWREGGLEHRTGASVLIHAGGSGVGTAAVQLCHLWGHRAFVTAGSEDKIARCQALGAEAGWNRHTESWKHGLAARAHAGVDVILDPVGADYLADDLESLGADGRLVLIGLLSGREASIDLGRVLMKRLRIQGSTLRARPSDFKTALLHELREQVWPAFDGGGLTAVVDRTFPLVDAEEAHAHLASNDTFGAIVLTT